MITLKKNYEKKMGWLFHKDAGGLFFEFFFFTQCLVMTFNRKQEHNDGWLVTFCCAELPCDWTVYKARPTHERHGSHAHALPRLCRTHIWRRPRIHSFKTRKLTQKNKKQTHIQYMKIKLNSTNKTFFN